VFIDHEFMYYILRVCGFAGPHFFPYICNFAYHIFIVHGLMFF